MQSHIEPGEKSLEELYSTIRMVVDPRLRPRSGEEFARLEPAVRVNMVEVLGREGKCPLTAQATVYRTGWLPSGSFSPVAWNRFAQTVRHKVVIIIVDVGEDLYETLRRARALLDTQPLHVSLLTAQIHFTSDMLSELVENMDLRVVDPPLFSAKSERVHLLAPACAEAA